MTFAIPPELRLNHLAETNLKEWYAAVVTRGEQSSRYFLCGLGRGPVPEAAIALAVLDYYKPPVKHIPRTKTTYSLPSISLEDLEL